MFDFVRKHNKVMQIVLFLLIVPSFVLVGINGYDRFREKGDAVAKVDGQEILQGDWDDTHKREVESIRQRMPTLDPKLLDSPAAKYATLERMVRDRVIASAALKQNLTASDARLARELQQNPLIASLRGPDGKLDVARYRQLVGAQGMSPQMFEESMRSQLSVRQVLAGVGGTSFATPAQAAPTLGAYFESREVQLARFNPADYTAKVNVSDADIEAFYKANPGQFQAPEQAEVEYLVLDLDSQAKGLPVNEQDLKTYYEQNVAKNAPQEQRRASHILIAAAKDAPAADREKARGRAAQLAEEARKSPEQFAALAKKNSDDKSNAANGGDLDWFARGAMTKPFEEAVFGMKKGEVSGVVETDFGFHVIRLTDIKAPKPRTFEETRPELEAQMRKQLAQKKYAESAEVFSNTVYEQADSLKPAADKLKLELRTATVVGRVPAPGATGALANPKFLAALFASDSIEKKRNTEAVEVAPSTLASGRILKYAAAHTRPLEEVKAQAREKLVAVRAAELARKEGEEKLAAWKANPAAASLPAPVLLSRQDTRQQPPAVVDASLRADPAKLPVFAGVDLGAQGYAVLRVTRIVPRQAPAPAVAQEEQEQYGKWWGTAENLAYYELLKDRFKAQILVPKPAAYKL